MTVVESARRAVDPASSRGATSPGISGALSKNAMEVHLEQAYDCSTSRARRLVGAGRPGRALIQVGRLARRRRPDLSSPRPLAGRGGVFAGAHPVEPPRERAVLVVAEERQAVARGMAEP